MVLLEEADLDAFPCDDCDLCDAVCPVFSLTRSEEDSPRHRVSTARQLQKGEIEPDGDAFEVMFRSSLCGRCDDVCPSELPISEVIIAARQMLIYSGPDRSRGMMDRLLREGTPFDPEPAVEIEGDGTVYFADPVSRSTGVANSVVRALALSDTGIGAIGGNSGLYNRILGDPEGLAENYSNFISVLEEREVSRLVMSNPEEMEHVMHHLDLEVEVLTLDELGAIGPTDREYLMTPFESRDRVPMPQVRSAGTLDIDCCLWGGMLPLNKHTAKDIASVTGDHLVTGDPLTWQILVNMGRDIVHVVDLLQ